MKIKKQSFLKVTLACFQQLKTEIIRLDYIPESGSTTFRPATLRPATVNPGIPDLPEGRELKEEEGQLWLHGAFWVSQLFVPRHLIPDI